MTIPIICPGCHLKFPVESGLTHAAANKAIANAMKLPPQLATALIRYLGLFAPKTRAINMDRLVRLTDELQEQINTGKIKYKGRSYNAPLEVWRIALEEIINKQAKWALPLDTHGLLYNFVGQFATKHDAVQEQVIEKKRHARSDNNQEEARSIFAIMSDIAHFENMAESMSEGIHKDNTLKTIEDLNTELEERKND